MQTSEKKIWKRVLSVLIILSLLAAANVVLGEMLTPVTYATYFNHDMEEIRKEGKDIDLLFVGASRTYRRFLKKK